MARRFAICGVWEIPIGIGLGLVPYSKKGLIFPVDLQLQVSLNTKIFQDEEKCM